MALLTITINDPGLPSKSAEVAYCRRAMAEVEKEFGRGNGTVTSGTIVGQSAAGLANTSLGSWTYTPSATKP
jgi:hypothetical protein